MARGIHYAFAGREVGRATYRAEAHPRGSSISSSSGKMVGPPCHIRKVTFHEERKELESSPAHTCAHPIDAIRASIPTRSHACTHDLDTHVLHNRCSHHDLSTHVLHNRCLHHDLGT